MQNGRAKKKGVFKMALYTASGGGDNPQVISFLESLMEKVDQISTAQASLAGKVDSLSTVQASLTGKVDSVSTAQANLAKKVDSVSTTQGTLSTKIDSVQTKVNSVSTTQGTLSTKIDAVQTKVNSVATAQANGSSAIRKIQRGTAWAKDATTAIPLSGFSNVNKMVAHVRGNSTYEFYVKNLTVSQLDIGLDSSANVTRAASYVVIEYV